MEAFRYPNKVKADYTSIKKSIFIKKAGMPYAGTPAVLK